MRNDFFGVYVVIFGFVIMIGFGIFMFFGSGEVLEVEVKSEEDIVLIEEVEEKIAEVVVSEHENIVKDKEKVVLSNKKKDSAIVLKSVGEADIERLAGRFIERFETYSNQSNDANMVDSLLLMSEEFMEVVAFRIEESRHKENDVSLYSGVTTRVVTKKVVGYKEGDKRARVLVRALRTEFASDGDSGVSSNVEYDVGLVDEGGEWKVDSFEMK